MSDRRGLHTIKTGYSLQRLFSAFPDGWPGFGLFLLRLGAGSALICFCTNSLLAGAGGPASIVRELVEAVGGTLLLAGLWTPVTGAFVCIDELWIAFPVHSSLQGGQWIHILLAVLAAGMAMLGPGAWSIDARLFGRKRFDINGSKIRVRKHPTK